MPSAVRKKGSTTGRKNRGPRLSTKTKPTRYKRGGKNSIAAAAKKTGKKKTAARAKKKVARKKTAPKKAGSK